MLPTKPQSSSSPSSSISSQHDDSHIILRTAVASRLFILMLIILWRSLVSPYDTSAILNPNCLSSSSNTILPNHDPVLWPSIGSAIEGSIVWDGVYFVRIAQCGYEYEQTYAFMPLLPICIYTLSKTVFAPLVPIIGYRAVLGLSGYVINNIAFVFSAIYFYRLSLLILKDSAAALHSSLLFCFNPASIFYSSLYSESLYSLFSLGGIYHIISGANNVAMLQLALSGSARSNGALNAGYFCFQAMHRAYDAIIEKDQVGAMHRAYDAIIEKDQVGRAVQSLVTGAVRSLFIFIPFIAFQAYGYYNICPERLSDEMSPWCKARLPVLYDYLQSHYWGVGFLRYFQFKQIPNFLLASPILSVAVCSILHYVKRRPEIVFSLGFRASLEEKKCAPLLYSQGTTKKSKQTQFSEDLSSNILQGDSTLQRRKQKSKKVDANSFKDPNPSNYVADTGYSSISVLPFILHLGFMAATAFFVMHVQVATRFLSASPPIYWFASYIMTSNGRSKRWGYLIWTYSFAYILLGSLLFSNFYPFT